MNKDVFSFRAALALALLSIPTFAFAEVPLSEMLSSKAGRFIFGDLISGTQVATRVIGENVGNSSRRLKLLSDVLADRQMQSTSSEIEARLNRVYDELAKSDPQRADALFKGTTDGSRVVLSNAERQALRKLVSKEFDTPFIQSIATSQSYEGAKEKFLRSKPLNAGAPMTAEGRALVYWETEANGASKRSHLPVKLENYEIPMDLLEADVASRISPDLMDALVFEKDGRKFVRWVINPEDTKHYKAVEKFLKSKGIDPVRHQTFTAYKTASRSYIVVDARIGKHIEFSAKVSTDVTGGNWRDKKQPVGDAAETRRATDFVNEVAQKAPFKHTVIMDEPAMFGIREIDQAMLIRTLADLPSGEVTYLPGFSAMHEKLGVKIAHANGATDVAAFWNEHYNKPLGRALGEFAAKTGLTYDSPHSQNFLIEMIGVKPTGRIVLRDFGDTYASAELMKAMGQQELLNNWSRDNIVTGKLSASVGILHGNEVPSWITDATYDAWGRDFYESFEQEFSNISGIARSEMKASLSRSGMYFSKSYSVKGDGWKNYLNSLAGGAGN